jgi:hypothetical protein
MKCEYCHSENQKGDKCGKCGALLPTMNARTSYPFFYNGYMVYVSREFFRDVLAVYFWLGERLIEKVEIPQPTLDEFVKEGEDFMPFFYELLKVARGENEVLNIRALNDKPGVRYEIRRIEEQSDGLDYYKNIFERTKKIEANHGL